MEKVKNFVSLIKKEIGEFEDEKAEVSTSAAEKAKSAVIERE